MEYYAHTSEDGMRRQTVAAHCRKAASYAAECLSSVGLSNTAYLAGLMHDTGQTNARISNLFGTRRTR